MMARSLFTSLVLSLSVLALTNCSVPQSGPDKTVGGAILGAGWGAGAGAVIGNQKAGHNPGQGAAIGAGIGAVAGALTGLSQDEIEEGQIDQDKELAALRIQNLANARQLESIQRSLDNALTANTLTGVYQVFFDSDSTTLRAGTAANLEIVTNTIKTSPAAPYINVVGHSDDASNPEYNERLAEARAKAVSAYLMGRGISADQIKVKSFGSQRPIASNESPEGRQLNRRVDIYITRD